jgi:RimJ/RimL family protein N-acetyltransferase
MPPHLGHLELLRIQAEMTLDPRGRERDTDGVTIASCDEGQELWIGAEVPDGVASELTEAFRAAARAGDPATPATLAPCRRILERSGPVHLAAGLTYVFAGDERFASGASIARSGEMTAEQARVLRVANPGNWHPIEWDELLDGRLGPWAMALDGAVVVSICHTPRRLTPRAAECGVWTRPGFRGCGHAAATTSEWAGLLRASGRSLFYGTDTANLSSQRVARRLDLELVGRTWHLRRTDHGPDDAIHPLSSLRGTNPPVA